MWKQDTAQLLASPSAQLLPHPCETRALSPLTVQKQVPPVGSRASHCADTSPQRTHTPPTQQGWEGPIKSGLISGSLSCVGDLLAQLAQAKQAEVRAVLSWCLHALSAFTCIPLQHPMHAPNAPPQTNPPNPAGARREAGRL